MKILLTHERIMQGASAAGGWNRKQIELLGVKWPLKQGWKIKLAGSWIEQEVFDQFLSLKGHTLAKLKHLNREESPQLPLSSSPPDRKELLLRAARQNLEWAKTSPDPGLFLRLAQSQFREAGEFDQADAIELVPMRHQPPSLFMEDFLDQDEPDPPDTNPDSPPWNP